MRKPWARLGSGVRAFVAVPVAGARNDARAPRSVDHLTLYFFGAINPDLVPRLEEALRRVVASRPKFEFVLEGVGAFPSRERPRVVWRGVAEGQETLAQLALAVRGAADAAGAPGDSAPFSAHLTLFRVRSARDLERARDLLDGRTPAPPPTRIPVTEVVLVESRLYPTGPEHRVLARFPLAERAD